MFQLTCTPPSDDDFRCQEPAVSMAQMMSTGLLIDASDFTPARELHKHRGRKVVMAGCLIAGKLVTTKGRKPRPMKFLSMEDLTGTFEVTLFPETYSKYAPLTIEPGPFLIRGRVEDDLGALSVVADHIELLK